MKQRLVGASRFPTTTDRVKLVVELIGDRKKVADGLGISENFIHDIIAGRTTKISRTLDLAAEAVLRRHGKSEDRKSTAFIVARIPKPHWPTTLALIQALKGKIIEEIEGLTTAGEDGIICIASFTPADMCGGVVALVPNIGGTVRVDQA